MKNKTILLFLLSTSLGLFAVAEEEYAFRKRLEVVHESGRRDMALSPAADEFVFADGLVVELPASSTPFMRRVARDFADYLAESMGVSVRVAFKGLSGAKNVVAAQRLCDLPKGAMALKERS